MSTLLEMDQSTAVTPLPPDTAAFMAVIERASTDEKIDVAKLEKLLEMYERVMARNAEMAFNVAFAQMQSEMPQRPRASRTDTSVLRMYRQRPAHLRSG